MDRKRLVRGIQTIVAITLATFALLIWRAIAVHKTNLRDGLTDLHPAWLIVAVVLALAEGVFGGMRMFVLSRVLTPHIRLRTVLVSEFVLMFVGGITPGQLGAPISQVAVLVHGGMRFAAIATAELLTAFSTVVFFLGSALLVLALRRAGLFNPAADKLDLLMGLSAVVFGLVLAVLVLSALWPPLLKSTVRVLGRWMAPLIRALLRLAGRIPRLTELASRPTMQPEELVTSVIVSIESFHDGFAIYLRQGKLALLGAQLFTALLFCSRFSIAYVLLLALGIPTTPSTFVAAGPPLVQVLLVQTVLNFALYLSPTPGASGIAEAGSNTLMAPWVTGVHELPYLVLWRILALFLAMFVGGVYVFRYLGTDVLEERVREAEAERESLKA